MIEKYSSVNTLTTRHGYLPLLLQLVHKLLICELFTFAGLPILPSKQLTSTVTYMFDSGNANIEKILAPLIFELAMCFENNIIVTKILDFGIKFYLGGHRWLYDFF